MKKSIKEEKQIKAFRVVFNSIMLVCIIGAFWQPSALVIAALSGAMVWACNSELEK